MKSEAQVDPTGMQLSWGLYHAFYNMATVSSQGWWDGGAIWSPGVPWDPEGRASGNNARK